MADYYRILGVDREATTDEVKKAFRKIARETHPDANPGDPEAEAHFRAAAEAYEVLSDPDRRRRYDRGDTFDLSSLFGSGGLDDILRSVFGDGGLFGGRQARPQRGRDVLVRVEIGLEQAAFGAETPVSYSTRLECPQCLGTGAEDPGNVVVCPECGGAGSLQAARRSVFGTMMTVTTCPVCAGEGSVISRPCSMCAGSGAIENDTSLNVEIPAGITSGTRLRLNGRGESGGRNGASGDLYVEVHVASHETFSRVGDDLVVNATIGIAQAALGKRIAVPLLEGGELELDIPGGTQPGTVFRNTGLGATRLGRRTRGDLLVEVKVEIPEALTTEAMDLLARYAEKVGEPIDRPTKIG